MYQVHTTPGFIVDSRPYGEAAKILSIFTRDFGLMTVSAQGIRLEKSKLRYHTRDYSFGTYSLIRGREMWRLTSAQAKEQGIRNKENIKAQELIARIAQLLKRFLHGEEAHPELFEIVHNGCEFLHDEFSVEELKTCESILVLQILNALGYIGTVKDIDPLKKEILSRNLLEQYASQRPGLNQTINKALRESQL